MAVVQSIVVLQKLATLLYLPLEIIGWDLPLNNSLIHVNDYTYHNGQVCDTACPGAPCIKSFHAAICPK